MHRDAQSGRGDRILNQNHMVNRTCLKKEASILTFSAFSVSQNIDFFSEWILGFSDPFITDGEEPGCLV